MMETDSFGPMATPLGPEASECSFEIRWRSTKNWRSKSSICSKSIYLQDNWTPDYNYLLFSSAPNESSAVSEGDDITFTVMRSGSGTQTKVYLKSYFDLFK